MEEGHICVVQVGGIRFSNVNTCIIECDCLWLVYIRIHYVLGTKQKRQLVLQKNEA